MTSGFVRSTSHGPMRSQATTIQLASDKYSERSNGLGRPLKSSKELGWSASGQGRHSKPRTCIGTRGSYPGLAGIHWIRTNLMSIHPMSPDLALAQAALELASELSSPAISFSWTRTLKIASSWVLGVFLCPCLVFVLATLTDEPASGTRQLASLVVLSDPLSSLRWEICPGSGDEILPLVDQQSLRLRIFFSFLGTDLPCEGPRICCTDGSCCCGICSVVFHFHIYHIGILRRFGSLSC